MLSFYGDILHSHAKKVIAMKSFEIKTKIHFGDNALERLAQIPYNRILVITDPFIANGPLIRLITAPLEKSGKAYQIFCDVVPDAPIDKITVGVKEMLEYMPDAIVAVGGGSAIDSSKAIREFALNINRYADVALIAIPTTSGTGSEVTSFAVVNDTVKKIKYPLVSPSLTAEEAILDAELVKSVPPAITADTGMDVLTHAIEAYVSTNHNEFSAALAEKAIEIVAVFLLRAYLNGDDTHARQKMHVASCLAGLAFDSASLGLTHGMAHQLGAQFHIPHGRANAMLLPHVIAFNAGLEGYRQQPLSPPAMAYAELARLLDLPGGSPQLRVRSLISAIKRLSASLKLPARLSDCRVDRSEFQAACPELARAALADICLETNPRPITEAQLLNLLEQLY